MNSKEKACCMAEQCAPNSTVAGGCRGFLCFRSGFSASFEIWQHWGLQGFKKKNPKKKPPRLQRSHRKTAQRIFTCQRHETGRSSFLVSGQERGSIEIQRKSPCQEHQPWGSFWERGSCGGPHHPTTGYLYLFLLWGILAYMDSEMKKAICFLMSDLGVAAWDLTPCCYQRKSVACNCVIRYQRAPSGRDCGNRCWPQPGSRKTNLSTKGQDAMK